MNEEYNWDDFDSQASEYLNSSDYQGPQFETGDGQSWGGNGDVNSQYNFNQPEQQPFDFSQYQQNQSFDPSSLAGQFQPQQYGMSQAPEQLPSMGDTGSTSNFLSQIFSGLNTQGGKGALTGLGALIEGYQNKKKASSVQNIVNQQQARMDPFGSQRPQYQQELSRTMRDPYSAPIVRNQVQQMQQAQAIKDAAAGRRSNQATSNPALLAAQAQVAQKYMDSLYQPAGANISPNASGLTELLQGNNAAINGYASPLMSAAGYNSGSKANTDVMQQIMDALAKYKSGG